MMEKLISRGEQLARDAEARQVRRLAQGLRVLFGSAAVTVEEARVLVRGRGIFKRWLFEPSLRFFGGGMK